MVKFLWRYMSIMLPLHSKLYFELCTCAAYLPCVLEAFRLLVTKYNIHTCAIDPIFKALVLNEATAHVWRFPGGKFCVTSKPKTSVQIQVI